MLRLIASYRNNTIGTCLNLPYAKSLYTVQYPKSTDRHLRYFTVHRSHGFYWSPRIRHRAPSITNEHLLRNALSPFSLVLEFLPLPSWQCRDIHPPSSLYNPSYNTYTILLPLKLRPRIPSLWQQLSVPTSSTAVPRSHLSSPGRAAPDVSTTPAVP
jgi:hypothetical protein